MSALRDLFAELADYFGEKYFSPDLGDLNYLSSDAAVRFLPLCIVGLCAGIFLAALIYYYNCVYLGRAVRSLYAQAASRRHCLACRHSRRLRGALLLPFVLCPRCGAACRQRDRTD